MFVNCFLIFYYARKQLFADSKCLFDNKALQEFIMICCQEKQGGLRDKPDK